MSVAESNWKWINFISTPYSKSGSRTRENSFPSELRAAQLLTNLMKTVMAVIEANSYICTCVDRFNRRITMAQLNTENMNYLFSLSSLQISWFIFHRKGTTIPPSNSRDLPSRGVNLNSLLTSKIWGNGPSFFACDENEWPTQLVLFSTPPKSRSKQLDNVETFNLTVFLTNKCS